MYRCQFPEHERRAFQRSMFGIAADFFQIKPRCDRIMPLSRHNRDSRGRTLVCHTAAKNTFPSIIPSLVGSPNRTLIGVTWLALGRLGWLWLGFQILSPTYHKTLLAVPGFALCGVGSLLAEVRQQFVEGLNKLFWLGALLNFSFYVNTFTLINRNDYKKIWINSIHPHYFPHLLPYFWGALTALSSSPRMLGDSILRTGRCYSHLLTML